MYRRPSFSSSAFTLIELLVVIAIIAILAVVVVLTLNPAEMLRQSRDANRVSDMATINSALNLYTTDQSGNPSFSLGNASSVYLSLLDTSSTCTNLGLPTSSGNFNYACSSATSSRNITSSGWIPVNLSNISSGSPLGSLPIDPVNTSSTGLYYTYYTNGSQYEVSSLFESQKNKAQYGQQPILPGYPEVDAVGNSLSINPLFNPTGLVGYWPMDEGVGSTTIDASGNGNNGTWSGTPAGTSGHYSPGKVGQWAGAFDGNTNTVTTLSLTQLGGTTAPFTISLWMNPASSSIEMSLVHVSGSNTKLFYTPATRAYGLSMNNAIALTTGYYPPLGSWTFVTLTYDGSNALMYINGALKASSLGFPNDGVTNSAVYIGQRSGGGQAFTGLLDDVRIYNRALSAVEIQALYNAEK